MNFITNIDSIPHGRAILNLLQNTEHYITSLEIQEKLSISRRSFYYSLKKINTYLDHNHIEPIANLKGIGYYLTDNAKKNIKAANISISSDKNFSANEREILCIWNLINGQTISISNLMTLFNISNHTAITDLNKISIQLEHINLHLKQQNNGKTLVGSEVTKRKWVLEQLNNPVSPIHRVFHFNDDSLTKIDLSLKELEAWTQNFFTDNAHITLNKFITWLLNRLNNPEYLLTNIDKQFDITNSTVLHWANELLQQHHINNQFEPIFLSQILNTSQFSSINASSKKTLEIQDVAQKVIDKFNIVSGSNINSYSLVVALSTHLLSTLYRVTLGIKYTHPDLKTFLKKYHELFIFTKYAIQPFESYVGQKLSDDEISLIAIYFGGQLREISRKNRWNTDVMLVCSSGIGTSVLLKNQLTAKYPDVSFSEPLSIFQFENCPLDDVKLIISTISFDKDYGVPTLRVSPLLTEGDLKKIDNAILSSHHTATSNNPNADALIDIISEFARIEDFDKLREALNNYLNSSQRTSHPLSLNKPVNELQKILTTTNIVINNSPHAESWQYAIQHSFNNMLENHSISQSYVDKIIALTQQKGPYMYLGNGVFLAHAAPQDGVKEIGLSLYISKVPIALTTSNHPQKSVNIIIGLAPIDQSSHLKVLSELFQNIQNKDWLEHLKSATTVTQVLEQIKK